MAVAYIMGYAHVQSYVYTFYSCRNDILDFVEVVPPAMGMGVKE